MRQRNDAERRNGAEELLNAAREHFAELQRLVEDGVRHYPLAYYLSGVCVECLFRAYMALVNAPFDEKHDLRKLAASSQFFSFMPRSEEKRDSMEAALSDVYKRWNNNYRYSSKAGLKKKLIESRLHKNGNRQLEDVLSGNWNVLYDSVNEIMEVGLKQWENSKQKWNA